ncbi:MAG: type II toxin-antitoxin system Phd/YefM family antitoxin [Candidatus Binatia bacterium]
MKRIDIRKASGSLAEYAREARKHPIIVVKNGKPVAALVAVRNADTETTSLSTSRRFLAIIERSRNRWKKEGGIPAGEIRRRLGFNK